MAPKRKVITHIVIHWSLITCIISLLHKNVMHPADVISLAF